MALTRPRASQINTVVTNITDPLLVLNNGGSVANIDVGFVLNRNLGTLPNVALFWDESANTFVTSFTTSSGGTDANVIISEYANLKVHTIFGNIGGLSNVYISGSLIPTANVTYDLGTPTQKFRSAYFSGTTIYIGEESISVGPNGAWTFSSNGGNVTLGTTVAFNPPSANISGNVTANYFLGNGSQLAGIATPATIAEANTAMKGYVDAALSTLSSNANVQFESLATLTANAAVQAGDIATLFANAGAQAGSIATLTSNAAVQAGNIATIFANLGSVSGSLATLTSNAAAQAGDIATLFANAAVQAGAIVDAQYTDAKVAAFLPNNTANVQAGNLTVTSLTANRIPFTGTNGLIRTSANLVYQNNGIRIVGTPGSEQLHIEGGGTDIVPAELTISRTATNDTQGSGPAIRFQDNGNVNNIRYFQVGGGNWQFIANRNTWVEDMRLDWGGNLKIFTNTVSTSTSTGALQVAGGVGVGGNIWAGNIIATYFTYANGQSILTNIDSALSTLTANAGAQAGDIATLFANAGAQAGSIATLTSNAAVQAGNIATIFANLGSVSGSLATLTANAGAQAGQIAAAEANIVSANTAMKGYVDGQITNIVNGAPATLDTLNELAAALGNDANLSVTITNQIANVNSNITTANTAMKGYVDGQISSVNSAWQANAGVQAGNIATLFSNAASQAGDIGTIFANLGSVSGSLATLTSNAAVQAGNIATLFSNAATQAGQIASAEGNITTANSAMKGYVDGQISSVNSAWQANAGAQAGDIATLYSNAAVQAGNIATIFANLGSVSGSLATLTANAGSQAGDIATIFANLGSVSGSLATLTSNAAVQAGNIATLFSNAGVQAGLIASAEGNITTANSAMKGYVDGQISSVNSAWQANAGAQAGDLATLFANAAVQSGNIATIFANLGSVSGSLATLTANAGAQAGDIATLFANAGAQAGSIATLTSNAAVQAGQIASAEGNITTANSAMKGYVDGQISSVNSAWQSNAGAQAGDIATLFANAGAQAGSIATLTSNAGAQSGSIADLYSIKANLASPSFTGNVSITGNLNVSGNFTVYNTNNISVSDGMIYLAENNSGNVIDLGFTVAWTDAVRYQHGGLVRDAGDGVWKLFANVVPEPTTTVDFTNAVYSDLRTGNIYAEGYRWANGVSILSDVYSNLGAVSGSLSTLTANAGAQSGDIATLFANAGAQAGSIATLTSNAAAQAGDIATLFSNAAVQAGDIATLFSNAATQAGIIASLTNYSNANVTSYLPTHSGNISATNANITANTTSTSSTTGALRVAGGVGVAGNIYTGGRINVGGANGIELNGDGNYITAIGSALSLSGGGGAAPNITAYPGLIARNETGLDLYGGRGNINLRTSNANSVVVTGNLSSTSTTTGALQVAGGVGIAGNLFTGGIIDITSTAASTSTSTGALIVDGGAGIAGNVWAGNVIATNFTYANGQSILTNIDSALSTLTANAGSQAGSIATLTSNAAVQAGDIATLFSNAAVQAGNIATIFANLGSVSGSLATLTANAGAQAGDIATLFANAGAQAGSIATLTSNAAVQAGDIATLFANAGAQAGSIATLNTTKANLSGAVFTGGIYATELWSTQSSGDEGGQLNLAPAAANTTVSGNVVIDIYQNRLRIFESSGTNRGGYFDITQLSAGVGTNLAAGGGGNTTPGGSNGQVQFNNSNTFGGAGSLYYYSGNGVVLASGGVASTSTTSGTFQVAGGIGVTGNVWADQLYTTNNNNGRNIRIGDDAWLGDVNIADTTQLMGAQNANNGYLRFGNVGTETLGRAGSGALTWTGTFTAANINSDNLNYANGTSVITTLSTAISTANTAMKGYVDGQISTVNSNWQANAGAQAGDIATLYSNAAVQAGNIATIFANLGSVSGSLATLTSNAASQAGDIATLFANAGAQAGSIATLTSNAAVQAGDIATLFANAGAQAGAIVTANTAMKGYVDGQITNLVNGAPATLDTLNELAAALGNDANLSVTITNQIANVNSNITTANSAMKGYVDGQISSVNSAWQTNAAVQAGNIATLFSNAAVQAGIIASLTNYSNANVASYLPTYSGNIAGLTVTGNLNVIGNLLAGGIQGSDGQLLSATSTGLAWVNLGNSPLITDDNGTTVQTNGLFVNVVIDSANVSRFEPSKLTVFGNVHAGRFIGDGSLLTGVVGEYGDADVAAYLPTYTGNISAGNVTINGDTTITGTGRRIFGDFSNATHSNRIFVQTSTANSTTNFGAIPNGTSTFATLQALNNSDPTNAGKITVYASSTQMSIRSEINGSGTYQPLTFFTSASERVRIDTNGNVLIGTANAISTSNVTIAHTTPSTSTTSGALVVAGGAGIAGNINAGNLIATNLTGTIQTASQPNITSVGTLTSLTVDGNTTISGTARRIFGDFSNGTISNRLAFQDFTANSSTFVTILPNGTSQFSSYQTYNNSNPTNSSYGLFGFVVNTEVSVASAIRGSGTFLPLTFRTRDSERVRIDINGNVLIGTANALATSNVTIAHTTPSTNTTSGALVVAGGAGIAGNVFTGGIVDITSTAASTSTSTGALIVDGGAGIAGNVNAGNVSATNLTGTLLTASQTNITGLGTVTTGTWNAGAVTSSGLITANTATGRVQLGTDAGGSISIGPNINSATTPYIDFNTSATNVDYDVRIQASGNVGTVARGNLTITAGNIVMTSADTFVNRLFVNSGNNVTAIVNSGTAGVGNIGASGAGFNTVFAKATSAQYADLAEIYTSDREYVPGTVVIFGGEREVTVSTLSHDPRVAGVVSTNPAYVMNNSCDGVEVALQGRVPTKVQGPVVKGDRLVTSSVQGAAERLNMTLYQPGCIIGKALEDIVDDSIQTIEVVVGRV